MILACRLTGSSADPCRAGRHTDTELALRAGITWTVTFGHTGRAGSTDSPATTHEVDTARVLIVLHAILAYLLAHRRAEQITRPVIRLSATTRELASGVLTEDLPITTDDELGLLTAAFNKMRVILIRYFRTVASDTV